MIVKTTKTSLEIARHLKYFDNHLESYTIKGFVK